MTKKPTYEDLEQRIRTLEKGQDASDGIDSTPKNPEQDEEDLERYRNIVSSMPDAISLLHKNYRYIIVNDAYEKFSGVDREHIVGLTVSEHLGQEVFKKYIQPNFDKCLHGETINFQEWFEFLE